MKKLVSIIVPIVLLTTTLQAQKMEAVKVSPFKAVTVQLPPGYKIQNVHPGLEDKFYTAKEINDFLVVLQATNNQEFPPSNVTVFCDTAIIYFDVVFQRDITKYNYQLTPADAVSISKQSSQLPSTTTQINVPTPMTDKLSADIPVQDIADTPDDTTFYHKDRLSLGQAFNNGQLLAYVSNLYGNDEFITVSLRIVNNSNVVYHTDAIDLFITTEVKKKNTTSIGDDDDATPYKALNTFPLKVEPGQAGLYIMRFRKFSLDKNNNIKLVAGEGKGRRTVSFEITSKMFYKYIQYY